MEKQIALEKFGLTNKESKIYLKLLEIGNSPASELAKKTGIIRQSIYEILNTLITKGLVSHLIRSGVKYFEAAKPSKFESILNEKQKIISSIMPDLVLLEKTTKSKPNIEFYEGVEGLKSIYHDILKSKPKELLEYGDSKSFVKLMKLYFIDNYIVKRIKNKIKVKLITEKDPKISKMYGSDRKSLRETKYLPEINNIKTAGYVYGEKVAMITLSESPIGIIIKSPEIAQTQKSFFNILWKIARK